MTKASGTATSIAVPANAGTYKLHVVDAQGNKLGESAALLQGPTDAAGPRAPRDRRRGRATTR